MKLRKAFCPTANGQLYYWVAGSGPPILLLHQAAQSSTETITLAKELADEFTVIGFDYPGHGNSDDPETEPGVPEFTDSAIAVLNELDVAEAHVCGHHSGGIVALNLGAARSDRVLSVTISGIGIHTDEGVRAILERPMSRDLPIDTDGLFLSRSWNVYRELSAPGTEPATTFNFFLEGLKARTRPYDAHYSVLRWDRSLAEQSLDKPTLLLCGEHDSFAEHPEQFADQIQGSRLVHIEGGGAFLFYEKPVECATQIKNFIDSL